MNAMILAAGLGQRMGELTANCPKVLLSVAGKALIDYHLENLASAGVSKIVINLHYLGDKIKQHVGNGECYGVEVVYSEEESLLGPGGGVHHALPLLGDEPFVVVGGDMWTDYDYADLPRDIQGDAHIVLVDNPAFHPEGDFQLQDGQVLTKSKDGKNFNYAGFGVYRPGFYNIGDGGSYGVMDLFTSAIAQQAVTGEYYAGAWANLNTAEQLAELNDKLAVN
jgi:MurNAc alpha-1-phosphate uridylyltransferase